MLKRKIVFAVGLWTVAIWSFHACKDDNPVGTDDISFQSINGFVISEEGTKLLATDKGLYSLDETDGKFKFVSSALQHASLNDLAWARMTPVKELWLAADIGAYNFTSELLVNNINSGLLSNEVNHLDFDYFSNTCFVTPFGISILNNGNWKEYSGLDNLFLDYEITDIASASNGFTYVTTYGGGIERFKIETDAISGATVFTNDWTLLETDNIRAVFIDDTTQVYGTDKGVAMHFSEFTKWDWLVYTTRNGLIGDTVLSVVKDHSDNWWFGTTRGISRLCDTVWTNYSFSTHNIISDSIKFLAVDIDGSVWFASDKGLSQFIDEQWINYSK